MKRTIIAIMIIFSICLLWITATFAVEYKYPDLTWITISPTGKEIVNVHFAAREITQATNIGILIGYPDGNFKPNDSITRAEFIKSLIVLATNRSFDFDNVDSRYEGWYGPYVTIAEMQKIIEKGQYSVEELNEPISRIEMILMLAKTQINMKGILQSQMGTINYTDIDNLTPDEKALVLHAAQYDLLEGMKEGSYDKLEPDKNLTRGEAAAALMRIY